MLENLPTGWGHDTWEAAKTAGPFGNMILLVIVIWISTMYRRERNLNASYAEKMFTLIESTRNALTSLNSTLNGQGRKRRA